MKLRSRCEPTYEWNFVDIPGKTHFSPIEMLSSFMDSMRDSVSVNCPYHD